MRLLLDTHFIIRLVDTPSYANPRGSWHFLDAPGSEIMASTVSLWEIAIKYRLGKLPIRTPLASVPDALALLEIDLLTIDHHHVLAELAHEPATRDPFDRLLLAQCQVESLHLVTEDRALAAHPLAWRGA